MADTDDSASLAVLAALVDVDLEASLRKGTWLRAGGQLANAFLITSATESEKRLASALCNNSKKAEVEAIALLLRLAAESPLAKPLYSALRAEFLDGPPQDTGAIFAAVYWQLGVPGLIDDVKEQAAEILAVLGR